MHRCKERLRADCGWLVALAIVVLGAPARGQEADAPRLLVDPGGFQGPVSALAFRPDGAWLAAAGDDKTVRIWDLATGTLRFTLRGQEGAGSIGACTDLAFSPDGRQLVVGVRDYGPEGAIRVYDTADPSEMAALLPGHDQGGVTRLAFSGDGKYLASVGDDGQVIIWDWPNRKALRSGAAQGEISYLGFPHKLPVLALIDQQGVHAWSLVHGKDAFALSPAEARELAGDFDPNALAQELNRLAQWRAQVPLPDQGELSRSRLDLDNALALMGGRSLRDGKDRYWVGLWSLQTGQRLQLYEKHTIRPWALAVDQAHNLVASADLQGEIHVWDLRTGQPRYRFASAGRPVYKVGFDASGHRLAFGTKSFPTGQFNYNHYAELDQTFDLDYRRLLDGAPGEHRTELMQLDGRLLTLELDKATNVYAIRCTRQGRPESRYTLPSGVRPLCYSLLRSQAPGFAGGVLVGRQDHVLTCFDPRTMISRREFSGHQGDVNTLSEAPDGRLLATGSGDGLIRIWSLENFRPYAFPDFDAYIDGIVNYVVPGGSSEKAGVRVGDQFLGMDGMDVAGMMGLYVSGKWPYQVGQRTSVDLSRAGQRYRAEVALVAAGDFVEPLLSLFVTPAGDWVIWTPQGYYDASLGGDRLIGWHVNQGKARAARFYLAEQFRKRFYRPDVIDQVLKTGDVPRALAAANAARPQAGEVLDPRKPAVVKRIEPPQVRIAEPADGGSSKAAQITVRAEIEPQNNLPVQQMTVLVNGRPANETGGADAEKITRDASGKISLTRSVTLLPGRNEIAVVAANQESSSRPALVTVHYEPADPEVIKPNLYILAVGVSHYARKDLKDLQFADRDAEDFAAAWKKQEGITYQHVEVKIITNDQATSHNVLDGMEWLTKSATQRDVAILFLASHALLDARRNYYLATHDIDPQSPRSTAVRWSEIKSLIDDLPGRFLLFVDTCHSGGVTGAGSRGLDVVDDPLRDLVSEATGAVVFASCLPRELSLEDPRWGHGAFTRAVLDILADPRSDLNGDGFLSLTELDYQIAEHVKTLTDGRQHAAKDWPPTVPNYTIFKFNGKS